MADMAELDRTPTLFKYGGDERIRTADLLSAIQALSQLSYVPTIRISAR